MYNRNRTSVSRSARRRRFNRRNTRARSSRGIIRVSNRRPKPRQTAPRPLNFGSGGISSTFRIVESYLCKISNAEKDTYKTLSSNIELTFSDILTKFPHLSAQYSQIRVTKVTATLESTANLSTKAQIGFALVPSGFSIGTPYPTATTIDTWLSSGVIAVKKAYQLSVAAWTPTQPDDYDYISWTVDPKGMLDGPSISKVICNAICIYRGNPSDLLVKSNDGTSTDYLAGTVTWDIQTTLRGSNYRPKVTCSPHYMHVVDEPTDDSSDRVGTPVDESNSPVSVNSV